MKKYKILHYGRGYINKEGNLMVCAISGNSRAGYGCLVGVDWLARSSSREIFVASLQTLSRVVPNDGNWREIDSETWDEASHLMYQGYNVKLPDGYKPSGRPIFAIKAKKRLNLSNS